jgi:hypothetical protein
MMFPILLSVLVGVYLLSSLEDGIGSIEIKSSCEDDNDEEEEEEEEEDLNSNSDSSSEFCSLNPGALNFSPDHTFLPPSPPTHPPPLPVALRSHLKNPLS